MAKSYGTRKKSSFAQKKKNLRGACDYAKKRVEASKKKTQRMKDND